MAKLSTEKRKQLADSDFGIPEKRMYPLNDKAHVESAVKLFGHASNKDKPQLAHRILMKAKEFGMDTDGWKEVNKWADRYVAESCVDTTDTDIQQEAAVGATLLNVKNQLMKMLGNAFQFIGGSMVPKFTMQSTEKPDVAFDVTTSGTNVEVTPKYNGQPDILHKRKGIALMSAANTIADFVKNIVSSYKPAMATEYVYEDELFTRIRMMNGESIHQTKTVQEGVVTGTIAVAGLLVLINALRSYIRDKKKPVDEKILQKMKNILYTYDRITTYFADWSDENINEYDLNDVIFDIYNQAWQLQKLLETSKEQSSELYKEYPNECDELYKSIHLGGMHLNNMYCGKGTNDDDINSDIFKPDIRHEIQELIKNEILEPINDFIKKTTKGMSIQESFMDNISCKEV